jgi:cleavage and polyadenylation specificity factor subunit 1
LQRDVRPYTVFKTDGLADYTQLWAVQSVGSPVGGSAAVATSNAGEADAGSAEANADSAADATTTAAATAVEEKDDANAQYVFLSKDDKTMVLACSSDGFKPVENGGFQSEGETVFVGNMGGGRLILQVYSGGARLLKGTAQVQHIPIEDPLEVVGCSGTDRYALLLLNNGSTLLLTLDSDDRLRTVRLDEMQAGDNQVIACTLYADTQLFQTISADASPPPTATAAAAARTTGEAGDTKTGDGGGAAAASEVPAPMDDSDDDDDDAFLYGDDTTTTKPDVDATAAATAAPIEEEPEDDQTSAVESQVTVWCVLTRRSGSLQIFEITGGYEDPTVTETFFVKSFMMTPRLLVDAGTKQVKMPAVGSLTTTGTATAGDDAAEGAEVMDQDDTSVTTSGGAAAASTSTAAKDRKEERRREKEEDDAPRVRELMLVGLANGEKPYLFCRLSTDQLAIYEAFSFDPTTNASTDLAFDPARFRGRLGVRFKKIEHSTFLAELPVGGKVAPVAKKKDRRQKGETLKVKWNKPCLKHYKGIQGAHPDSVMDGVFVSGPYPVWIMTGSRKALRFHPMWQQGAMRAFTPFTHSSCGRGFITMGNTGTMSVGSLAAEGMTYDAAMLTRKIKLRASPISLSYHSKSGLYVLITKKRIPEMHEPFTSNEEIPKDPVKQVWGDRYIPPDHEQFAVQLVSPNGWVIIPNTRIDLGMYDNVTDCKTLSLRDEGSESGLKEFVVISTSRVCGEEVTAQGRLVILDILDVVPEPGQPLTKNKFKRLLKEAQEPGQPPEALEVQKGSVTCIGAVDGFLISCMVQREGGSKVYVWNFENHEMLMAIAFCHTSMYIANLSVIENIEKLIVVGDLYQSIAILRFVTEAKMVDGDRPGKKEKKLGGYLGKVSQDIGLNFKVTGVQFYVQSDLLSFVATDEAGNVVIHCYVPDDSAGTSGGRCLVRRADYHLGARATNILRIGCRPLVAGGLAERQGARSWSKHARNLSWWPGWC